MVQARDWLERKQLCRKESAGVLVYDKLSMNQQSAFKTTTTNCVVGCINKKAVCELRKKIIPPRTALLKQHLCLVWSPPGQKIHLQTGECRGGLQTLGGLEHMA